MTAGPARKGGLSARQRAEEAEARFRILADHAQSPVFVHVEGRIAYTNPAIRMLMAIPPDQVAEGMSIFEFVSDKSASSLKRRNDAVQAGEQPNNQTMILRRLDGTEFETTVHTVVVQWEGKPASQVTLHPRSPEDVAAQLALDIHDAVIATDSGFRIIMWNEGAARLYGWSEDEVLGRDIADLLPADQSADAADSRALPTGDHWHGVVSHQTKSGNPIDVQVSSTLLRNGDEVRGLVLVNRPVRHKRIDVPSASGGFDDELLQALRHAVDDNQIRVHFQPIIRLSSNDVVKVEALARWDHPVKGAISPEVFIRLAEGSGLIAQLGHQVLELACRQAAQWRSDSHPGVEVAVNLSAVQLGDPDLAHQILQVLCDTGLSPHALWLEVTETALIENLDQAETTLRELHLSGVRIAIDDFGTGYSSLSYLKRFPVQALKIDQGFVAGVVDNLGDRAIVRSVLHLGRELGLTVVAEGIETVDQMEALGSLGCRLGQGFLFGHPVAGSDSSWHGTTRRSALPALKGSWASETPKEVRRHAIRDHGLLDGEPRPGLDAVVRVAAAACNAEVALLSLVDEDRQWITARVALEMTEAEPSWGLAEIVIAESDPLVVPDLLADPRFRQNSIAAGPEPFRFFAGAAVTLESGLRLGALCVLGREPQTLDASQVEILEDLAVQASLQIRQLSAIAELERAADAQERAMAIALDQAALLQSVLDSTPDVISVLEYDGSIRFASASVAAMLDLNPDAWVGRSAFDLIHPDDIPHAVLALAEAARLPGPIPPVEVRLRRGDGSWTQAEVTASSLPSEHTAAGVVVNLRDVGPRHALQRELDRQGAFATAVVDNLTEGIVACDEQGRLTLANQAVLDLFGLVESPVGREDWATALPALYMDGGRIPREDRPLTRALAGELILDFDYVFAPANAPRRVVRVNASPMLGPDGSPLGAVLTMRDITAVARSVERLRHEASHDELTGLPNRRAVFDRLPKVAPGVGRYGFVFVDLDDFKEVNDVYGHAAGDEVLVQVARRLRLALREMDIVGRVGGDEFAVLCPSAHDQRALNRTVSRIRKVISQPIDIGTAEVVVHASCGALLADPGEDRRQLLARADALMYADKRRRCQT